jgi:hypothetical protein
MSDFVRFFLPKSILSRRIVQGTEWQIECVPIVLKQPLQRFPAGICVYSFVRRYSRTPGSVCQEERRVTAGMATSAAHINPISLGRFVQYKSRFFYETSKT